MEGHRTTGHSTLSVLFRIALCMCVVACLTQLGTILQMGSGMGCEAWCGFAVHPVRHALLLWQHKRCN